MLLTQMDCGSVMQKHSFETFHRAVYEKSPIRLIVDHANTVL